MNPVWDSVWARLSFACSAGFSETASACFSAGFSESFGVYYTFSLSSCSSSSATAEASISSASSTKPAWTRLSLAVYDKFDLATSPSYSSP